MLRIAFTDGVNDQRLTMTGGMRTFSTRSEAKITFSSVGFGTAACVVEMRKDLDEFAGKDFTDTPEGPMATYTCSGNVFRFKCVRNS